MTNKADVAKSISYAKTLEGIRTQLASVMSKIDSSSKFEIDGSITPELIFFTSESDIDKKLKELEELKSQVDSIVTILSTIEVPTDSGGRSE